MHESAAWSRVQRWRVLGQDVLAHGAFQCFIAALIVLNAVLMGLETEDGNGALWDALESALLFCFTAELAARVACYGWAWFCDVQSAEFVWNMFDAVIVAMGVCSVLFGRLGGQNEQGGLPTLFRSFRLVRIFRIFRLVKLAKRLYVLAYGFMLAAVAIFWVTILMLFGMYVCAIVLVRTAGRASESEPGGEFLRARFGTLKEALFTLFELSVKPNLQEFAVGLQGRPALAVFLVLFIVFGSFGMIALLTGVIGEAMFVKNVAKLEEEIFEKHAVIQEVGDEASRIFDAVVTEEGAEARQEDVLKMLPAACSVLGDHGMICSEEDLEKILLLAGSCGVITREEFCRSILQLAEDFRPILLMELHYDSMAYFKGRMDAWDHKMDDLASRYGKLRKELRRIEDVSAAEALLSKAATPGSDAADNAVAGLAAQVASSKPVGCGHLRDELSRLGHDVRELRKTLETVGDSMELVAVDFRPQQQHHAGAEASAAAARRGYAEVVSGVSRRVGECEFVAKQACAAAAAVERQQKHLRERMRSMIDRLPPRAGGFTRLGP